MSMAFHRLEKYCFYAPEETFHGFGDQIAMKSRGFKALSLRRVCQEAWTIERIPGRFHSHTMSLAPIKMSES